MRRSFRQADFQGLVDVWNSFYPKRYRVDPIILRSNTIDCAMFDWGASFIHEGEGPSQGFVSIKKSAPGHAYAGIKSDVAHLSAIAYAEPEVAVDLLAESKKVLKNRGVSKLVFGQDLHHFFPGCPTDCHSLSNFLMVEGFERHGEACDLERDLSDYEAQSPAPDGVEMRRLTEGDVPRLDDFLGEEFPGRWRHDVMAVIEAEKRPDMVFGMFKGNKVIGFAFLQDEEVKKPVNGGVWRSDLGEKWGGLGPIGVAENIRGHGYGHALLGAALADQRARGVRRCIIDWTGLVDFYGKHGFRVTRRYKMMSLDLEAE
jgi:predicted N-acetyltransferase YhbS